MDRTPTKFTKPRKKKSPLKKPKSARYWSEEEKESLIEIVKNYPCLFDTACKEYKDITVKTNAKVEISNQFEDCTVDDVSVQWNHLVDKFRRIRKIMVNEDPSGTGTNDSAQQQGWDLYEQLTYLDKHIKQRARYTNAKVGNTKTVTECPISKEPSPLSDEDSLLESNISSQFSMEFNGVTTEELSAQTEEFSGKEQELLSEGSSIVEPSSASVKNKTVDAVTAAQSSRRFTCSTPTPSSTDELPSYPESRVRNKRKAVEMQADRDISYLITLLANDKPEKPNNKEVSTQAVISKETADWRNYCKVFADKVADIKSKGIKRDLRFNMEQLLYNASKQDKEKEKKKKRERESKD